MDDDLATAVDRWLYCHWDTHDHDVQFPNEEDLDRHLYTHYVPAIQPQEENARKVECHWDSCHETFNIDQVMEHFHNSHQDKSFRPHYGSCEDNAINTTNCYINLKQEQPDALGQLKPEENKQSGLLEKQSDLENMDITKQEGMASPFVRLNNPTGVDESRFKVDPTSLPTLPNVKPSLGVYQCMWHMNDGICGEQFFTSSELNAHIVNEHTRIMPHICEWSDCNRARMPFAQRQKLVRHLQTHAKNSEHKCHECQKVFSCASLLSEHKMCHEIDKPFTCTVCGKSFRARNSYNIHLRVHTGAKPLVCPFPGCGKRFSESSNLAKHRKTHMAPEYACPTCERRFTRRDHLNRHMKTKGHGQFALDTDHEPTDSSEKSSLSPQLPQTPFGSSPACVQESLEETQHAPVKNPNLTPVPADYVGLR